MMPEREQEDKATEANDRRRGEHASSAFYPAVGETRSWKVIHNRVEYRGEVVVADSWQAELAREIKGEDAHFRIVFLTEHRDLPPECIADQRIAICVPKKPVQGEATGQHRAVREGTAVYETVARGVEQTRYSDGYIHAKNPLPINAKDVFCIPDDVARINLIVSALLADTYAALPVDASALRRPLSSAEVGKVFDGFFETKSSAAAKSALDDFAVGLGLAKPDDPHRFDPRDCRVFQILIQKLREHEGQLAITDLCHNLAISYGLTWPLITLYLLCLVRYGKPALELRLKPQHQLTLRSGERFSENKLTSDTVPRVFWTTNLSDALESLCYAVQLAWDAVLPYARLLGLELEVCTDTQRIMEQETALADKLEALGRNIEQVRGGLELLSTALSTPERGVVETLERLSRLAQTRDHTHFHSMILEENITPDSLAQDLSLYHRLQQLVEVSADIMAAKTYIDGAVLRESDQELAMDRLSIQGQINLQNLLPNPSLWSSVRALFDWFKSRYRILCEAHHRHYHQEMASLHLALEESEPQVDALHRLNSIPELGEPFREELFYEYRRLLAKARPCSIIDVEEIPLDTQPLCPCCGLLLTSEPPTGEVEQFLDQLGQALKGQFRRLSSEAIRQILAQSGEERVDQFIKVIQTSDLSSLVNVMDDELVDFLRRLLRESESAME